MKKSLNLEKFLLFAAILLVVGFLLRLGTDVYKIMLGLNSAPFWLFLLVRAIVFLIPAAGCFIASVVLKKRRAERNEAE